LIFIEKKRGKLYVEKGRDTVGLLLGIITLLPRSVKADEVFQVDPEV